ncbi:AAA family ATPase [Thetidibacter halocola]|uniref:AAA family ATPase n=1 Tax=Thetidibacter halocola TaxID=2827239 RepID=A0A8J7WAB7_9RHOB|nr:MoxR family ATPase [Thetidibacter halocola]MBS0123117.1 AAA family ATPase [Thetidibacter halocola]
MTVNARHLPAGAALEVLRHAWQAQAAGALTASWMLHGRPGVGKTQIVTDLAAEIGALLFDLRLTTIEPQDLRGLPYYDHETRRTVWYRPEDLPDTGPAVLFLDELTAAAPQLQPVVYGLLQERRVGGHRLPDDVLLVAAGNMVEDGALAYEMGTALSDRLIHLVVTAEAEDWLRGFALPRGLHPAVTAFIRTRPDLLETTEEALRRGETVACTPRSWERVSQIMVAAPARRIRDAMIAGTVGAAAAAEFALVADDVAASVQIADMLACPRRQRTALYPASLHGLTALACALPQAVDRATLPAGIEILEDMRHLGGDRFSRLPLSELAAFGFEALIARALDQGWEDAFAGSDAYAAYAAARQQAGL